jgi:hypothetical protein
MTNPDKPSRSRATPRQVALVAVLSVVFVVVLIMQFGGSSGAEQATERRQASARPVRTPSAATASGGMETTEQRGKLPPSGRSWPTLEPKQVLSHDPFRVPADFTADEETAGPTSETELDPEAASRQAEAARRQAEQQRTLAKLREQGVTAIVGTTKGGRVAVVGSQVVRVGDVLEGFRVIAVEPDGLVLQLPVTKPPPPQPE